MILYLSSSKILHKNPYAFLTDGMLTISEGEWKFQQSGPSEMGVHAGLDLEKAAHLKPCMGRSELSVPNRISFCKPPPQFHEAANLPGNASLRTQLPCCTLLPPGKRDVVFSHRYSISDCPGADRISNTILNSLLSI